MNRVLLVGGALLFGLLSSLTRTADGQTVSAVPNLEISRYIGAWHEIARLPNNVERKCVGSPVVLPRSERNRIDSRWSLLVG